MRNEKKGITGNAHPTRCADPLANSWTPSFYAFLAAPRVMNGYYELAPLMDRPFHFVFSYYFFFSRRRGEVVQMLLWRVGDFASRIIKI